MKNKRILSLILSIAIMLPLLPAMASAQKPLVVYTEFSSGNYSHTGQGTAQSPYNLFEDALEAVADGGTIYIGENGAFVNDENDGQPFKITKSVTITHAPNTFRPALEIRKGGLVLGADVNFSNIILSFPNANHAAVFANGYTLVLDNVSYNPGAHVIQLVGGTLYNISNQSLSPAPGGHSQIIISGKDTQFGNIYAGSINGSFAGDVDIKLSGISGSAIGDIYSCGAREGYYNSENFLDPDNEPEAPVAYSPFYPVSGNVSIELTDSPIRSIDGITGGASNASLTVSSKYQYASDLKNIGNITVKSGTFAPKSLNNDVNVNIETGGILDLSSIPECTINNFDGNGGILILKENGCLTVNGSCQGSTELRTPGGTRDTSGIAVYNHLYIKTISDAEFTFNPYSTQSDMTLNKTNDGWRTSEWQEQPYKTVLKNFDIVSPVVVTSHSQVNGYAGSNTVVEFNAEFTEDTTDEDLSMIPFEYDVTYNGKPYDHIKSIDNWGTYIGVIPELYLNFVPGIIAVNDVEAQGMMIVNWSDVFEKSGDIPKGIYDIKITAPTESGNITRSMRLTVTEDGTQGSTATQTDISISSENTAYNGFINVTANITSSGQPALGGDAVLYINGKPYSPSAAVTSGSASWQNIPVTHENGFEIGSNSLEALYGGNETYSASNSESKALTVSKASIKINHSGSDTTADYTGSNMNIDFGEFSFTDENNSVITLDALPEISYTDEHGNAVNPIMPGTYTAKLNLPEGAYYTSVSQTGPKLTINPAEPAVILGITEHNGGSAKLHAEVIGLTGGRIPTGSIEIIDKKSGNVNKAVNLNGGNAEIELTSLEDGENNFYAIYKPDEHSPYTTARSEDICLNVEKPTATPTAMPTTVPTSVPTATPTITPTTTPTTMPSPTPTVQETWTVSGINTGNIEVTFTNLTEQNIENAVMIIAAYDAEGTLQKLEKANQNVNAAIGDKQKFSFDLSNVRYSQIKIFVWNSLDKMEPVCENYDQKEN